MTSLVEPGVTVVIATRDRVELLRKAVHAALAQDYAGPVEVVAVYDGTDPDTGLERDDEHRRVRVTRNTCSPGLPGARNTGIGLATQPLVGFCDDDDTWLPAKLRAQAAALVEHDVAASVTGIRIRYGDEVRVRSFDSTLLRHADLVRDRVVAAHPSSYLVRRDLLLERIGLVDEQIPGGYGEDYDWLLRVAQETDIACVAEPMVEVLWHPGSYFTRRWDVIVDALDYLLDKHPAIRADPRGSARIEAQRAFGLAALGRRGESWQLVRRTLPTSPGERRLWATLAVLSGVVGADRVLHLANKAGRGI